MEQRPPPLPEKMRFCSTPKAFGQTCGRKKVSADFWGAQPEAEFHVRPETAPEDPGAQNLRYLGKKKNVKLGPRPIPLLFNSFLSRGEQIQFPGYPGEHRAARLPGRSCTLLSPIRSDININFVETGKLLNTVLRTFLVSFGVGTEPICFLFLLFGAGTDHF